MAHGNPTNSIWTLIIPLLGIAAFAASVFDLPGVGSAVGGLFFSIILCGCVFASVHHAEIIAARVGEPFGSIILAIAITVIEVGLILTLMVSAADGGPTIARDTVFAAVMIIVAGVVGLCLLLGSRKHFEQVLRVRGTSAALAGLATLATITLILPNYTVTTAGPTYNLVQLTVIAVVSLILYGSFLFVQTVRHRDYFIATDDAGVPLEDVHARPSANVTNVSALMLCLSLLSVVVLAKTLSAPLKDILTFAGLPASFVGVVIATLVLLPESIAACRAALADRLQTSINLALGSGLASIGLTIPAVAVVAAIGNHDIHLGISAAQTVMLVLALFISVLTLGTGRTNVLLGIIHLCIFGVFIVVSAVP